MCVRLDEKGRTEKYIVAAEYESMVKGEYIYT